MGVSLGASLALLLPALPPPLLRLEYDAYRTDLEELNLGPRDAGTLCRLDAAQANFQAHRLKYEKLRADVAVKLKFLEENKVLGGGCCLPPAPAPPPPALALSGRGPSLPPQEPAGPG